MELSAKNLHGVIAAIPTPFTKDDEVDETALRRLVTHLIRNRVHGIMTCGGTGEFPHLMSQEKDVVNRTVVEEASGKIPIIACTTACSVRETAMNTRRAKEAGVDGVIIVPPYYFPLNEVSLYKYYESVANSVEVPMVIYNNPGYTKINIRPELMFKIAKIKNVIGVKQSQYDISQTFEMIRMLENETPVLTGIDSQFVQVLMIGGRGVFSTAASVIPKQMVEIYEAMIRGDHEEASEIQKKIHVVNRFFEYDPGYVAPCKEALTMLGMPVGKPREPLPVLTDDERRRLRDALRTLGLSTI
ncbi:MAG TPA: 4-hydroxy-tetrahydrodipicolinate synthase [Candidatus Bathyarchaeia archaeon]|nr:4-hydroxy-tetrahydrodipicolinate synthase [Candidatus Bathyarchaeia archaeon]